MATWTDERVEHMRARWAEGASAGEIAREIGGVSRNAVIGKLHRLGIAGRGMALPQREHKPRIRTARDAVRRLKVRTVNPNGIYKLQPPPMPSEPLPEPVDFDRDRLASGESRILLDLGPHHCRWPVGSPDLVNERFCCAQQVPGLMYCEHHAIRSMREREAKPVSYVPRIHDANIKRRQLQIA